MCSEDCSYKGNPDTQCETRVTSHPKCSGLLSFFQAKPRFTGNLRHRRSLHKRHHTCCYSQAENARKLQLCAPVRTNSRINIESIKLLCNNANRESEPENKMRDGEGGFILTRPCVQYMTLEAEWWMWEMKFKMITVPQRRSDKSRTSGVALAWCFSSFGLVGGRWSACSFWLTRGDRLNYRRTP